MVRRPLACAVLLPVALLPAQASRPAPDDVRAQLRKEAPASVASGAFLMAEHRVRECAPELLAAVARAAGASSSPDRERLVQALLDAAVQTETQLPPEDLARFLAGPNVPLAAIVLASRDPHPHIDRLAALLSEEIPVPTWSAAFHVLYGVEPTRALGLLLTRFELRVRVEVFNLQQGSCGGLSSIDHPRSHTGGAWPPQAEYRVTTTAVPGSVPLGRPPLVTHAARSRPEPEPTDASGLPVVPATLPLDDRSREAITLGMLTTLAGLPSVPGALPPRRISHHWESADAWQREVAAPIAVTRAAWDALLDRLRARGHIDAEQRQSLSGGLVVEIDDLRRDRSARLPALVAVEATPPSRPTGSRPVR